MGMHFSAVLDGIFLDPQVFDDNDRGHPATAKAALRDWPIVKVSVHDIEESELTECPICLARFEVGEAALRIFCGHLFHRDCVKVWLKASNLCPVCRYELPTDDAFFEVSRRLRMVKRRPRLRRRDLAARAPAELRHLAKHLGVTGAEGVLHRRDLVEAIATSGCVTLLPDDAAGPAQGDGKALGEAGEGGGATESAAGASVLSGSHSSSATSGVGLQRAPVAAAVEVGASSPLSSPGSSPWGEASGAAAGGQVDGKRMPTRCSPGPQQVLQLHALRLVQEDLVSRGLLEEAGALGTALWADQACAPGAA